MNLIDKDALMWRKTGHGTPCLYEEDIAAAKVIMSISENPTNGDVIRTMSDKSLSKLLEDWEQSAVQYSKIYDCNKCPKSVDHCDECREWFLSLDAKHHPLGLLTPNGVNNNYVEKDV